MKLVIDGKGHSFEAGITAEEIIKAEKLDRKKILAIKLNNELLDLTSHIDKEGTATFLSFGDEEGKEIFRHSAAHILAQAMVQLYPDAKPTIGPAIEEGFYYDFDLDSNLSPEELGKIEKKMKDIIKANARITKSEVPRKEALEIFKDNPYKRELIEETGDEKITIYETAGYKEFCRGPHVPSTGYVRAVKLTKIAGAYWRGNAQNKMLQRIYGIAYPTQEELELHVKLLQEAEKRDHRIVGRELDLVYFHEFSPGAPFFLKNGTIIYNILVDFVREEYKKRGYEEVITPQLYNKKLWEISGHWEHYKENMFVVNIEGQEHSLKPMNCPSHCLIYNRDSHSYKDLPIRIADFCMLHRNELSGTLAGLFRVRKFAQDDSHIFCRFDQIEDEVLGVLEFIKYIYTEVFHFKLEYYLSTRPEKAMGSVETWNKAEEMLANALKRAEIKYKVKSGEGAFYGPKIDVDIEDTLGRKWQCPTCQLDFNLPQRFDNFYVDQNSQKQNAVMIHRAILGSVERFIGILIEHFAGRFPLWLSPTQIRIMTVSEKYEEYAKELRKEFEKSNLRVELDVRAESVPKKVRDAQKKQIPLMITIGEKEVSAKTVAVRTIEGKVYFGMDTKEFLDKVAENIKSRKENISF